MLSLESVKVILNNYSKENKYYFIEIDKNYKYDISGLTVNYDEDFKIDESLFSENNYSRFMAIKDDNLDEVIELMENIQNIKYKFI